MRTCAVVFACVILPLLVFAQRGTAPSGYYPPGYNMDTFTGTVVAVDAATNSLTLEYKKDSNTESFSVKLESGCRLPISAEPVYAKDVPVGSIATAYYMPKEEKVQGKTQKIYVAFGVLFRKWGDEEVPEQYRKLYSCRPSRR